MSIGFPASYRIILDCELEEVRLPEAIRTTLMKLGWEYWVRDTLSPSARDATSFLVLVPMSWESYGEQFVVEILPGGWLRVTSTCTFPQCVDWGKNRRNVETFRLEFGRTLKSYSTDICSLSPAWKPQ
jgi:hypothetical protein